MQDYIETLTDLNWNILLTAKHGELLDYVTNNQMLVNTELDKNINFADTGYTFVYFRGGLPPRYICGVTNNHIWSAYKK